MHLTCRSCHVPPEPPAPDGTLRDCAVCHVPERSPESLYRLMPDRRIALAFEAEESLSAADAARVEKRVRERLEESPVLVSTADDPLAVVVAVALSLEIDRGRTDRGARFWAARGTASVRLHRAAIEVEGRPGVSADRDEAVRRALDRLAEKIDLAITW